MLSAVSRPISTLKQRCRNPEMLSKVCDVQDTIPFFKDGMYVGWSGFTPSGDAKAVPIALAQYVERNNLQGKLRFNLLVGGSAGSYNDNLWAKNKMIARRYPYQTGTDLQKQCNSDEIKFCDRHVSTFPTDFSWGFYSLPRGGGLDIAVIEASEILEDGSIILGSSVGSSPEFAAFADKVIIEVNTAIPSFKGYHDITSVMKPPFKPLNICSVSDRIGTQSLRIDPKKVVAIVESQHVFPGRTVKGADADSKRTADHIIDFFTNEVKHGRMPENLYPLQSGVGNIANAILESLNNAPFGGLQVFSEIIQEGMLPMFESGKMSFGSATGIAMSDWNAFYDKIDFYRDKVVLRNQAVSNAPEVIRRLGCIAMNTPVEVDMYAHANSSHVNGTRLINGIGGSGDFERNGYLSIVHCPSARKTKKDPTGISCIVPMCTHVDHTEHDLDVVVTEQGLADLRGLCPTERAKLIIEKCAHPSYKDQLNAYLEMATRECQRKGMGHEPQLFSLVFKMQDNLAKNGTMHLDKW